MKMLLPQMLSAIKECVQVEGLSLPDGPVTTMYRAEINGVVYYSRQYQRVKKRNSYTFSYLFGSERLKCFGFIECFVFIHNRVIAVFKRIHPLQVTCHEHFQLTCPSSCSHIIPVSVCSSDSFGAIFASKIVQKCLFIECSSYQYVVFFPTSVLFDKVCFLYVCLSLRSGLDTSHAFSKTYFFKTSWNLSCRRPASRNFMFRCAAL